MPHDESVKGDKARAESGHRQESVGQDQARAAESGHRQESVGQDQGRAAESGHRQESVGQDQARADSLEGSSAAALCSLGLGILGSIARAQTEDLLKDIAALEAELLESVGSSSNKRKREQEDASAAGKRSRQHKSKRACVLCKAREPAVAFVPCGHAACEDCGFKKSESPEACPACGSALSPGASVQRIFLS